MAYAIYRRKPSEKTFKRAFEFVVPIKKVKITYNGLIPHEIRCETIEEAKIIEAEYIAKGFETKIKEVK